MRGWVCYAPGCWRHRPLWKRIVNGLLRLVQTRRRPARLLVVATMCEPDRVAEHGEDPPVIIGYALQRVLHL